MKQLLPQHRRKTRAVGSRLLNLWMLLFAILVLARTACASPSDYFRVTVVDASTGRGVPLVELETVNSQRFYTDSSGIIAIDEPDLMGQTVWFSVSSDGYQYPKDGFGYRGIALKVQAGARAVIKLRRVNIAERLYRLTGAGIYRDSVLVGAPVPIRHPLMDGQVMGQDTVMATPYRGKIYWFFGDTERPSYPLGQFATSGATSRMPGQEGLDPSRGVNLTYWVGADGFSRPMLPLPHPTGPIWVGGVFTLIVNGTQHLFTHYTEMMRSGKPAAAGLAEFDDAQAVFKPVCVYPLDDPLHPDGQSTPVSVGGQPYWYFPAEDQQAYPLVRVRAKLSDVINPHDYQAFTCLAAGTRFAGAATQLDRTPDGRLIYSWKTNTPALGYAQQQTLITDGKMTPNEALTPLRDVDTDAPIQSHGGSVFWNAYLRRWILISGQDFGSPSFLGEIWFSEADTPVGPWVYAKKIITHRHYTFYNPAQHPFFDQNGGRTIYFEGTYTDSYSGVTHPTPRYNYNQIMYRLNLADSRLALPVPVYQLKQVDGMLEYALRGAVAAQNSWGQIQGIPFFAIPPDRSHTGLIPISAPGGKPAQPLFYALPPTPTPAEKASPGIVPLYQYTAGKTAWYSTDAQDTTPGATRSPQPLCRVWRNPSAIVALDKTAQPRP